MSRLDTLKKTYPELNVTLLDLLASADPTTTYKYCDFLVKNFRNSLKEIELVNLIIRKKDIKTLSEFEEHFKGNRIKNKDISKYNNFLQIEDEVITADKIVKEKEAEKQIEKLYESDHWLILIPKTWESAKLYGNGTKWCVTQKSYWDEYEKHSKIIYIFNKLENRKYAISKRYDNELIQGWNSEDKEKNPIILLHELNDELWGILRIELFKNKMDTHHLIKNLDSNSILLENGTVVPINGATNFEIDMFIAKYVNYIGSDLMIKLVNRKKEMNLLPTKSAHINYDSLFFNRIRQTKKQKT